ncbi:purine-nucleoside phosphorylase [candidate division WOR-3 bacterium]|nr:purine-nucleoside phosphorylase [candidate division WOR-3 bacterium]
MTSNYDKIKATANYLKDRKGIRQADILLILGSGQSSGFQDFNLKKKVKYSEIPNFPVSTVKGHKGELILGELEGKNILIMNGRFHLYEGYSAREIAIPIQTAFLLGVKSLIITNAAGGINRYYKTGDIVMITDHINLTGENPLIGHNMDKIGERFPQMNDLYTNEYQEKMMKIALELKIELKRGIYAGLKGPNLETGAELNMLQTIGADLVGMSTVTEVIAAKHAGMKIAGLSIVTNAESPGIASKTNHDTVIKVASKSVPNMMKLVEHLIKEI